MDWGLLAGPIGENTLIYESTNQVQRVLISKKVAWMKVLDRVEVVGAHGSIDLRRCSPTLQALILKAS